MEPSPQPNPPASPSPALSPEADPNDLLTLEPVPTLLAHMRRELSADFDFGKPIRVSRAPGRLDVMGGIADYTGSLVCEQTIDRAAAVAVQDRGDRQVQVFSFNLLDEHLPFMFRIPMEALARTPVAELRREFNESPPAGTDPTGRRPGDVAPRPRRWAGYIAGCLAILHQHGLVDLLDPLFPGLNVALYSTVPLGAGLSSSAAIEVATMINLVDHFNARWRVDALELASLCQQVENEVVGVPCGIMDQAAACAGQAGSMMRMLCQPHTLLPPLGLPAGMRVVGVNSNVRHSVGGGQYPITRCAAFMAHSMILSKMREMGEAANRTMEGDPMSGYLANLDPEDYKRFFRPYLPDAMLGGEFLTRFGPTIDGATSVDPTVLYPIQRAADHHVLEAQRVRNFIAFVEEAGKHPHGTLAQGLPMDKAGHLMYASHLSYTNDALLGASECDLLVDLVRKHEKQGLYGAKITGGGAGGTVAILADCSERSSEAIEKIMGIYHDETGRRAEAFLGSSPGGWQTGSVVI